MLPSQQQTVRRHGNGVRVVGPSPVLPGVRRVRGEPDGRQADGKATKPSGVQDALCERYGDGFARWTPTGSLPALLDEAAEYLCSREALDGVDFGTWQKMRDLR